MNEEKAPMFDTRSAKTEPVPTKGLGIDAKTNKVYFLAGAGMVKVGYSGDYEKRIRAIRNSSPVPLEVLGVFQGNRLTEGLIHDRLAQHRKHGEWFVDCAEVRELIEGLRVGGYNLWPTAA